MGLRFLDKWNELRLAVILCADDMILCGELEGDLKTIVGHIVAVCRRSGLKVNEDKSKVVVLGGEEGISM